MRVADIILLVVVSATLLVGIILQANLGNVANQFDLGVTGNATRAAIISNAWTAFNLASIGLIVLGAVGILSLLMRAFMGGGTAAMT